MHLTGDIAPSFVWIFLSFLVQCFVHGDVRTVAFHIFFSCIAFLGNYALAQYNSIDVLSILECSWIGVESIELSAVLAELILYCIRVYHRWNNGPIMMMDPSHY
jgi:hypothetical protein